MKSVLAHGVLALLGLLAAYRTWTHEEKEEKLPGEVTVQECEESKLAVIEVESPTHMISYRPKHTPDGIEYWVTVKTVKDKKPDAKADTKTDDKTKPGDDKTAKSDTGKSEPTAKPSDVKPDVKPDDKPKPPDLPKQPRLFDPDAPVTFRANKKFSDTLKSLVPLRATRSVGEIPKAKFKDFGFDKVGTHLRVDCGERKVGLEIGARTYGSGDQYARDPKTGQAYLINGQLLMDLQSAQFKFMQAEMHGYALGEVDEATVQAQGKQRRLLQRNRLVPQDATWVDAAAADKRNELFENWLNRIERLKAKSYLAEGKDPGSDLQIEATAVTPVVTVEYKLEGKPKGKLELVRVDTQQGPLYYARTETTRHWTTMYDSLAKQVDDDVAMVVGGDEAKAAQTPASSSAPSQSSSPASPMPAPAAPQAAPKPSQLPPSHPQLPPSHPQLPPSHPQLPPSHPPIGH